MARVAEGALAIRYPREAAIFVVRGDRFLVMRRSLERYWHVAAGVVEPGESFAEAARRELREETGLDVPLVDLDHPQRYVLPDEFRHLYAPGTIEVIIHNFVVEAPPGWEPLLNDEHDTHRWCLLDEALALLRWPEARDALGVLAGELRYVQGVGECADPSS